MARTKQTPRTISTPPRTPITAGTSNNDATNNSSEDGASGVASASTGRRTSPRRKNQGRGKNEAAASEGEEESNDNDEAPSEEDVNGGANNGSSNEDHSSDATSKDTNDEPSGGFVVGIKEHLNLSCHMSYLHLLQYYSEDGAAVMLNVNANTVKSEISSPIQNTLAGNPTGAEATNVANLGNSILSAVISAKPRSDKKTKVTDVSCHNTCYTFFLFASQIKSKIHTHIKLRYYYLIDTL